MEQDCRIPVRTCVVCGKKGFKHSLVRLALDPVEKVIVIDGKKNMAGRGAYTCPGCARKLVFSKRVQHAFRGEAKGLACEGALPG